MRARIAASSTMRTSRCCRSLFDGDDSATAASVSSTAAGSGSGLKRRMTPRPARRRMASLPASISGTAPISPKRRSSSSCRVFMKACLPFCRLDYKPTSYLERIRIAATAAADRLPTVYGYRDHVEAGDLISYGVDLHACLHHEER